MPDRLGPFEFLRLDQPPQRAQREWEVVARAGVSGTACWSTGDRGRPFAISSEAVALNFAQGRTYYPSYVQATKWGPQPLVYGTNEEQQFFKVLGVELVSVRAIPRLKIGGDANWYTCLVVARWTLLPIDPTIQRPT